MATKAELEKQIEELKAKGSSTKAAKKTRTVKLPEMVKLKGAGIAVGVDTKYPTNLAVFKLRSDGELAQKGDGTVKKPARIKRDAMLAMLDADAKIRKLCEFELPTE